MSNFKNKPLLLLLVLIFIAAGRYFMLFYKWPDVIYNLEIFSTNHFGLSDFNPSLGDFFINTIGLIFISIGLFYLFPNKQKNKANSLIINVLLIILSLLGLIIFNNNLANIYKGSQYLFDLKLNIPAKGLSFKIITLAIFVFSALAYILIQYFTVSRIFIEKNSIRYKLTILLIGLFFGLVCTYFKFIGFYLFIGNLVFWTVILFFDIKISLKYYYNKTTLFIVLSALTCSYIATYINYTQSIAADYLKKQENGKQRLENKDQMSEFLIELASASIKANPRVKELLNNSNIYFEKLDQEIIGNNFKNWFDKYDININYFDKYGKNIKNKFGKPVEIQWNNLLNEAQTTIVENTYLTAPNSISNRKKYVHKLKLTTGENKYFSIIILLYEKLYPVNGPSYLSNQNPLSSTILFENEQSNKIFNQKSLINNPKIFNAIVFRNDTAFTAIKHPSGKIALVYSKNTTTVTDFFRTFSFLFLLLFFILLLAYLLVSFLKNGKLYLQTFTTKIQLFFGLAFIFPLFLTLILIFNSISKTYLESQNQKSQNMVKSIAEKIINQNEKASIDNENKYFWREVISETAFQNNVDLFLYKADGQLITTNTVGNNYSFPIGTKLDKNMLTELKDNATVNKIFDKSNIIYTKLINAKGEILGVLAIPFIINNVFNIPESAELFGAIITIFAFIILLFLLVSYFISDKISTPIRLLTSYLQNTDLAGRNKKIIYQSNDELGFLVDSYNKMLGKIEEGKTELAQAEKQTAWQDIAKQVAHEIKNPLTPMKLTLQHLQNNMDKGVELNNEKFKKSISNLIYNIDNISDIVDSFMKFAKLPMPKISKIDLLVPVKNVFELYKKNGEIELKYDGKLKKAFVLGDEKLIYQIINNLIINALQSIPEGRLPIVSIELINMKNHYLLKISDNGIGISEELQRKIFMPNFTTKAEGIGIGLSLAKWGIENMNGKIWLESLENEGTTFFIELPKAD